MSDLTDMIDEALSDAICNGDGRPTAKHLLVELEQRGLAIARLGPTDDRLREIAERAEQYVPEVRQDILVLLDRITQREQAARAEEQEALIQLLESAAENWWQRPGSFSAADMKALARDVRARAAIAKATA